MPVLFVGAAAAVAPGFSPIARLSFSVPAVDALRFESIDASRINTSLKQEKEEERSEEGERKRDDLQLSSYSLDWVL